MSELTLVVSELTLVVSELHCGLKVRHEASLEALQEQREEAKLLQAGPIAR